MGTADGLRTVTCPHAAPPRSTHAGVVSTNGPSATLKVQTGTLGSHGAPLGVGDEVPFVPGGLLAHCLGRQAAVVVPHLRGRSADERPFPEMAGIWGGPESDCVVTFPIVVCGTSVGVLMGALTSRPTLHLEELRIVQGLASLLAMALVMIGMLNRAIDLAIRSIYEKEQKESLLYEMMPRQVVEKLATTWTTRSRSQAIDMQNLRQRLGTSSSSRARSSLTGSRNNAASGSGTAAPRVPTTHEGGKAQATRMSLPADLGSQQGTGSARGRAERCASDLHGDLTASMSLCSDSHSDPEAHPRSMAALHRSRLNNTSGPLAMLSESAKTRGTDSTVGMSHRSTSGPTAQGGALNEAWSARHTATLDSVPQGGSDDESGGRTRGETSADGGLAAALSGLGFLGGGRLTGRGGPSMTPLPDGHTPPSLGDASAGGESFGPLEMQMSINASLATRMRRRGSQDLPGGWNRVGGAPSQSQLAIVSSSGLFASTGAGAEAGAAVPATTPALPTATTFWSVRPTGTGHERLFRRSVGADRSRLTHSVAGADADGPALAGDSTPRVGGWMGRSGSANEPGYVYSGPAHAIARRVSPPTPLKVIVGGGGDTEELPVASSGRGRGALAHPGPPRNAQQALGLTMDHTHLHDSHNSCVLHGATAEESRENSWAQRVTGSEAGARAEGRKQRGVVRGLFGAPARGEGATAAADAAGDSDGGVGAEAVRAEAVRAALLAATREEASPTPEEPFSWVRGNGRKGKGSNQVLGFALEGTSARGSRGHEGNAAAALVETLRQKSLGHALGPLGVMGGLGSISRGADMGALRVPIIPRSSSCDEAPPAPPQARPAQQRAPAPLPPRAGPAGSSARMGQGTSMVDEIRELLTEVHSRDGGTSPSAAAHSSGAGGGRRGRPATSSGVASHAAPPAPGHGHASSEAGALQSRPWSQSQGSGNVGAALDSDVGNAGAVSADAAAQHLGMLQHPHAASVDLEKDSLVASGMPYTMSLARRGPPRWQGGGRSLVAALLGSRGDKRSCIEGTPQQSMKGAVRAGQPDSPSYVPPGMQLGTDPRPWSGVDGDAAENSGRRAPPRLVKTHTANASEIAGALMCRQLMGQPNGAMRLLAGAGTPSQGAGVAGASGPSLAGAITMRRASNGAAAPPAAALAALMDTPALMDAVSGADLVPGGSGGERARGSAHLRAGASGRSLASAVAEARSADASGSWAVPDAGVDAEGVETAKDLTPAVALSRISERPSDAGSMDADSLPFGALGHVIR